MCPFPDFALCPAEEPSKLSSNFCAYFSFTRNGEQKPVVEFRCIFYICTERLSSNHIRPHRRLAQPRNIHHFSLVFCAGQGVRSVFTRPLTVDRLFLCQQKLSLYGKSMGCFCTSCLIMMKMDTGSGEVRSPKTIGFYEVKSLRMRWGS